MLVSQDAYTNFFLNSKSSVVRLELLTITHSAFSKQYNIVRNATEGVWVTVGSDNPTLEFFEYYPLKITLEKVKNDLDYSLQIIFGDLGDIVPSELDLVRAAEKFDEKPQIIYSVYRSDFLDAPMTEPVFLEITSFTTDGPNTTFIAKAPSVSLGKTGEIYTFNRFPGLRSFL